MKIAARLAFALFVLSLLAWPIATGSGARAATSGHPTVIAHRGASGYRPEHTLAAYALAIDLGADYVEPDLCATKDGALVARHENEISGTTDVADHPEFAGRRTTKTIDGEKVTGWFTEDFTLAELKTLRARDRMPKLRQHNTIYDGHYQIPTFQQIIELVKTKEGEKHRTIGIYPEAKHPTYFAGIGLATEKQILDTLERNGYKDRSAPIFIQCFEPGTLKRLHGMTKLALIQLIDEEGRPYDFVESKDSRTFTDMVKPAGLAEIAIYAQGIGPNKNMIVPRDKDGNHLPPTSLIADAHKAGLLVHPWTFRNENAFLPADWRSGNKSDPENGQYYGDAFAEYKMFYDLGVDGVFSENPDTAVEARNIRGKADNKPAFAQEK